MAHILGANGEKVVGRNVSFLVDGKLRKCELSGMDLLSFRKSRGLSQEQCAIELGLSARSKGWISEIESGTRAASLKLALKIERWSDGEVPASSICPAAAQIAQQGVAA